MTTWVILASHSCLFVNSYSNSDKPYLNIPFQFTCIIVPESLTHNSIGKSIINWLQCLCVVFLFVCFSLKDSSPFRSCLHQAFLPVFFSEVVLYIFNTGRFFYHSVHSFLRYSDFLNVCLKIFAYIKVLSLCCRVLWILIMHNHCIHH